MLYRRSRHLLLIRIQVSNSNKAVHRKEKRKNNLFFLKAVRDLDYVYLMGIACASYISELCLDQLVCLKNGESWEELSAAVP